MLKDPKKRKQALDDGSGTGSGAYAAGQAAATAPANTAATAATTPANTAAQQELVAAYGEALGVSGLQKGSMTDRAYQEAVNRYAAEAERTHVNNEQAVADSQYTADAQAIREAAERGEASLALSRDRTRREAGILLERMSRYLGNMQRVSGTAGTGAADADAVSRYNEVIRTMQGADRSYEEGVTALTETEMDNRTALDIEKQRADAERAYRLAAIGVSEAQGQIDIDNQFRAEEQAVSTQQYTVASEAVAAKINEMASKWGDGKISEADMKALRAYADSISGGLSDRDRQNLDILLDSYAGYVRNGEEAKLVEETVTGATVKGFEAEAKKNKNMVVSIGKTDYDVQIERIMADEDDANVTARAKEVPADTVFSVGGSLYIKLSGNDNTAAGTVVKLEGRGLNSGNGDYKDLKEAIEWESKYGSKTPVTTPALIEAASDVRNGKGFKYDGVRYIKAGDGKIYEVKAGDDYEAMLRYLKNQ